jgi:hypothetical protein
MIVITTAETKPIERCFKSRWPDSITQKAKRSINKTNECLNSDAVISFDLLLLTEL